MKCLFDNLRDVFVEEVNKAGDSWAIYPLVDGLGSSMPSKLDLVSVEKGSRVKFFKFRKIKVLATAKPRHLFSRGFNCSISGTLAARNKLSKQLFPDLLQERVV